MKLPLTLGAPGAGQCTWKAHYECPHKDTYYHGLCGYKLDGAPDFYVNEEWFGLSKPTACNHFIPNDEPGKNPQHFGLDTITVRPVMKALQKMWNEDEYAKNEPFVPMTCEEMLPCWQCLMDNRDKVLDVPSYRGVCAIQCGKATKQTIYLPALVQFVLLSG